MTFQKIQRPRFMKADDDTMLAVMIATALVLLFLYCFYIHITTAEQFTCSKGHYLRHSYSSLPMCHPCPNGTFISEDAHAYTECSSCSKADLFLNEKVLEKCTPQSNSKIGCATGYCLTKIAVAPRNSYACLKCNDCDVRQPMAWKECATSYNLVQCPNLKMLGSVKVTNKQMCLFMKISNEERKFKDEFKTTEEKKEISNLLSVSLGRKQKSNQDWKTHNRVFERTVLVEID